MKSIPDFRVVQTPLSCEIMDDLDRLAVKKQEAGLEGWLQRAQSRQFSAVRKSPFRRLPGSGGLRSRPSQRYMRHILGVVSKECLHGRLKNHHSELALTFHRLYTSRQYKKGDFCHSRAALACV